MINFDRDVLKDFRQKHDLTQTAAAKMAGIHVADWSKYERGVKIPSENARKKLNALFELEKNPKDKPVITEKIHHENEEVVVQEGVEQGSFSVVVVNGPKKFIEVQEFIGGGFLAIDEERNYYTVYPLD